MDNPTAPPPGTERTFHMARQPTRTRRIVAIGTIVLIALLAFAMWFLSRNAALIARVIVGLIALVLARLVLLTGLRVYRSNPFLVLDDEGVWFGGWWPANDPGNWKRKVHWDEIAYARAFEEGPADHSLTLQFYGVDDSDAVLADLHHVEGLEKTDEMLAMIARRTGRPVLRQAPSSDGGTA